jgi:hypothetical protein
MWCFLHSSAVPSFQSALFGICNSECDTQIEESRGIPTKRVGTLTVPTTAEARAAIQRWPGRIEICLGQKRRLVTIETKIDAKSRHKISEVG